MTITAAGKHTHKALRAHEATEPRKRRGLHVPAWLRRRTTADAIADALSQPLPAPIAGEFTGAAFEDTAPWRDAAEPEGPEVRDDGPDPAAPTLAETGMAVGVTGAPPFVPVATADLPPRPPLWLRRLDTLLQPVGTDVRLTGGPLFRVVPLHANGLVGPGGAANLGETPEGSIEVAGPPAALRSLADALCAAADAADREAGLLADGAEVPVPAEPDPEPITEEAAEVVAGPPASDTTEVVEDEAPAAEADPSAADDDPAPATEAPEAAEPVTEDEAPEAAVDAEAAA